MEISKKTFGYLITVTFLLLLYVHEQTSILHVSYSIQKKEREVAQLSETYKLAKFRVARLRSPQALNHRLKELSFDLTTPTEQEIIRILKPKIESLSSEKTAGSSSHFFPWLNLIKEAQAKTSSKE